MSLTRQQCVDGEWSCYWNADVQQIAYVRYVDCAKRNANLTGYCGESPEGMHMDVWRSALAGLQNAQVGVT